MKEFPQFLLKIEARKIVSNHALFHVEQSHQSHQTRSNWRINPRLQSWTGRLFHSFVKRF